MGCSDVLTPQGILVTWELQSVNGFSVPGEVVYRGRTYTVEYERFVLLSVVEESTDGSSKGSCRWEYSDNLQTTTADCEYEFNKPSETLTLASELGFQVRWALDGNNAVWEAIWSMPAGWEQIDHERVYRKR
jgi:hypothetical protein